MDTLAARLAFVRRARGLSQPELAERIGVSAIVVSRYERGKLVPRLRRIERIAEVLGVSFAWLVSGEGDAPVFAEVA